MGRGWKKGVEEKLGSFIFEIMGILWIVLKMKLLKSYKNV